MKSKGKTYSYASYLDGSLVDLDTDLLLKVALPARLTNALLNADLRTPRQITAMSRNRFRFYRQIGLSGVRFLEALFSRSKIRWD